MTHWKNTERVTTAECNHCLHHTGKQMGRFDGAISDYYQVICCHCGMRYLTPHAPLTHGRYAPKQAALDAAGGE